MLQTPLMAVRSGRTVRVPEAEPVLVETSGDVVRLALDDGEVIDFDRAELLAALDDEAA